MKLKEGAKRRANREDEAIRRNKEKGKERR